MDPYDVLGIPYNSTWKQIRHAYKKMLIQTHPDKMGSAKYFMMVHEAYASIKKQVEIVEKQTNYPVEKSIYKPLKSKNKIQKPNDQFDINKFNAMFEQYSKLYEESDPFMNGGYKTCGKLNYQEDIKDLTKKKVHIPKRELIIFKEPEALVSSSLMENVYHLGINKVDDYTCKQGSDYMRAYSEEAELIDNRTKYNNLDHIKQIRSTQSFQMTEEDKKYQRKLEKRQHKLEQMRRQNVKQTDNEYEKIHSYISNRISN